MTPRRRRICLVTPGHLATNPRLVKEADAFHEAGYEVRVVAARFLPWADEADEEFRSRPWRFERIPFGPLARRSVYWRQSASRRILDAVARFVPLPRGLDERSFHPVVPDLTKAASREPADLYVAHNLAALPAAAAAARRHGARLGFDAEDLHEGELPDVPSTSAARERVRRIEARYLSSCDYVTAASPLIARAYSERYRIPEPLTVLNVFPLRERPDAPTTASAPARPAVYWFSQTLGPGRGLEGVVAAMDRLRARPHLYLRGREQAGFTDRLRSSTTPEVATRIHVLPPIRPGEIVRDAARFDVGLCVEEPTTPNRDLCLANKIFVCLLAGLPVLLSETRAHREILPRLGIAARSYAPDATDQLAASLDELLDENGLADRRAHAWRLGAERFNWDSEKGALLERVEGLWR